MAPTRHPRPSSSRLVPPSVRPRVGCALRIIRSHSATLLAAAAAILLPPALAAQPPAFPGAEGFGAIATGGRGGQVLYVTNLDATGPGSLQAALDTPGPRYVLFKVSGLIDSDVQLTRGDVTIAGQTSPGGILVRGFHTTEDPYCDQDPGCIATAQHADNWILRHLRTRPGLGGFDDGLRLLHTRRAIVDHVSVANATDEAVQISFSNDITIQHSTLAETLGGHANLGGMLMNYSQPSIGFELSRLSIHHNVWNRIIGRLPEVTRESPGLTGNVMDLELSNNLLWDAGYFVEFKREAFPDSGNPPEPIYYRLNWVENFAQPRAGFQYGMISFPEPYAPNATSTYLAGNRMSLYPALEDWDLNYCCDDFPVGGPGGPPPAFERATRHAFPAITYQPSSTLRTALAAEVGAFPRDPMDRRLLAPVASGVIDPAARDANPYGDAYLFDFDPAHPPAAPADRDGDGMPDAWEVAHGLDPDVQDHNGTQLSVPLTGVAGYTNLECYLDELADTLVAGGGGGGGSTCVGDETTLCLHGSRFRARATWRTASGTTGPGHAVSLTDDAGYFWFFAAANVEVLVKSVDACTFNARHWVFSAGLTDVRVDLTVEDLRSGATKTYVNPLGQGYQPILDTDAFATCP